MGLRATVIKKYVVEWGDTQGFNYAPDTLDNILRYFCDEVYSGDDIDGVSTSTIWEIDKEQFKQMIAEIKRMSDDEFNRSMKEDWGVYSDQIYSKQYVLDVFEGWLRETPEDDSYVRIGWL